MTQLSVRQIKPTQRELRRIVKDRQFAAGLELRKQEAIQLRAFNLYTKLRAATTQERKIRIWLAMDKIGFGDWARKG